VQGDGFRQRVAQLRPIARGVRLLALETVQLVLQAGQPPVDLRQAFERSDVLEAGQTPVEPAQSVLAGEPEVLHAALGRLERIGKHAAARGQGLLQPVETLRGRFSPVIAGAPGLDQSHDPVEPIGGHVHPVVDPFERHRQHLGDLPHRRVDRLACQPGALFRRHRP